MAWEFKLPELDYWVSNDTIGEHIRDGTEISMHCYECERLYVRLNLVQIAKRYGMDYDSLEPSLKRVVSCAVCKEAGRPRKNIGFIVHPLTAPHSKWPPEKGSGGPFIYQQPGG